MAKRQHKSSKGASCTGCGAAIPADAKFCPSCGAPQQPQEPQQKHAPSEPWQARNLLDELLTYLDGNPGTAAVAAFEASAVLKDAEQGFFEGRPRGRFTVWQKHVCFLTPEANPDGAEPSSKLLGEQIQTIAKIGMTAFKVYNLDPETLLTLLAAFGKMLSDGTFSNAEQRWLEASLNSPNSFIIPLSAIQQVKDQWDVERERGVTFAQKLTGGVSWNPPNLEITTPSRSYWIYEEDTILDMAQPPQLRIAHLVMRGVGKMIHGWRPEMVKFLKEATVAPAAPAGERKPAAPARSERAARRKKIAGKTLSKRTATLARPG